MTCCGCNYCASWGRFWSTSIYNTHSLRVSLSNTLVCMLFLAVPSPSDPSGLKQSEVFKTRIPLKGGISSWVLYFYIDDNKITKDSINATFLPPVFYWTQSHAHPPKEGKAKKDKIGATKPTSQRHRHRKTVTRRDCASDLKNESYRIPPVTPQGSDRLPQQLGQSLDGATGHYTELVFCRQPSFPPQFLDKDSVVNDNRSPHQRNTVFLETTKSH